jgi:hypothetical protein
MTMELPADLSDLVSEVLTAVPRLLTLQDRDPDSPMRGCMHPAFWRDKSSEVADMRRQEAALAFAWIWKHPFPGNRYQGDPEVLHASLRAMGFWTRNQHRDGTFDEWYKNEHGYATTAFSSYAMSLALLALEDAVPENLRQAVLFSLRRSGDWLLTHDDWFKTNHQAVGVAALCAIGRATDEVRYIQGGRRNADRILKKVHEEGWSREISGTDLGYTFLLCEYMAMFAVLSGDTSFLPSLKKPYRFAVDFLHPNLTTGAEYGVCANPYFSRVAAVALAPHDPLAQATVRMMERKTVSPRDTSATLKDDLRLSRYAYQPLLAALLHTGDLPRKDAPTSAVEPALLPFERLDHLAWYSQAKLLSVARPAYAAWVSPAYGGFVRACFRSEYGFDHALGDRGYAIEDGKHVLRNAYYSLKRAAQFEASTLHCESPFVRAGFVMPPYWARLGLRFSTSLPGGPRASRWLIDQWRKRKGTALNQSSAGVAKGKAPITLSRRVTFHPDRLDILDVITSTTEPLPSSRIHCVLDGPWLLPHGQRPDMDRRIPLNAILAGEATARQFEIRKSLAHKDGRMVLLELAARPVSP